MPCVAMTRDMQYVAYGGTAKKVVVLSARSGTTSLGKVMAPHQVPRQWLPKRNHCSPRRTQTAMAR